METRRLILAVILVIAVVLLYNRFFVPEPKPRPQESPEASAREATSATSKPGEVVKRLLAQKTDLSEAEAPLQPSVEDGAEKEIVVDTNLFRVVLTTNGGAIKSLRLRRHKDLPPDFVTAKERLVGKNADEQPMNEFQLANAREVLSETFADFRKDFLDKKELSSADKDRLKELLERFYGTAKRVCHSDFVRRRASASRLRQDLSDESSGASQDTGTMRRVELLEGVELVPPYLSEIGEYMLKTVYPVKREEPSETAFKAVRFNADFATGAVLEIDSGFNAIRFEASFNDNTVKLIKEYRISADSYVLDLSCSIEAASSATADVRSFETWLGPDVGSSGVEPKGRYSSGGIVASEGSQLLDGAFGFNDMLAWAALQDRYFIVALARQDGWLIGSSPFLSGFNLRWVLPVTAKATSSVKVFAGPKDIDELERLGKGLERVVDFGWFRLVAKPIYVLLKYLYSVVGNYGVAIILLALLIKIVFYPLTVKQTKSMKKMQVVGPQMKMLREKYKNDKERLNKEIMALYKKHEVNPMGGCLPILIQFPVLIALIRVLPVVIELRQAPFIFWLHDLSEPDPYYVAPILMGAAMIVQQKMTPSSDPKQAKMMLMMSVVFTFLFLNFSSGLVLYWFCGTIFQLVQQLLMNKSEEKAKAVAER